MFRRHATHGTERDGTGKIGIADRHAVPAATNRDRWSGEGGGSRTGTYCGAASEESEEGEAQSAGAEKARVGEAATMAGSTPPVPAAWGAPPRRSTWTAKK